MYHVDKKFVSITPPAAIVDNAAFATGTLDTLGFAYAEIFVYLGALDIAVAALKVTESDDSGMAGETDITGTVFGTDANDTGSASTLPSATDDNKCYKFEIDLRGRKRYLDLKLTGGDGTAGTFACAFAFLSRGAQVPTTAAEKGIAQLMRV